MSPDSLIPTLVSECQKCDWIEVAYVAPGLSAFCIQSVVGRHKSTDKGWATVVPTYSTSSEATHAILGIISRMRDRFPDVDANAVSYVFRPGGWKEVYRKSKKA